MEKWHYIAEGRQEGPVDEFRLALLLRQGEVMAETWVWRQGLPAWLPLSEAMPQLIRKEEPVRKEDEVSALADLPRHTSFTRAPGKRALEAKKAFTRRPGGEAAEVAPEAMAEPAKASVDETAISASGVARELLPARVLDFALDPASVRLNEVNGLKILKATYEAGEVTIGLQFLKVNSPDEGEETAYIAAKSAGVEDPVATRENPKLYQVLGRNDVHFAAWTAAGVVFTAVSPDEAAEQRFLQQYLRDTLGTLPAGASAY